MLTAALFTCVQQSADHQPGSSGFADVGSKKSLR